MASILPSGLTASREPPARRTPFSSPVAASYSVVDPLASPPAATVLPSGRKTTDRTGWEPPAAHSLLPVATSHMTTVVSLETPFALPQVTRRFPSGEKLRHSHSPPR